VLALVLPWCPKASQGFIAVIWRRTMCDAIRDSGVWVLDET
jgi:hypothetical protein